MEILVSSVAGMKRAWVTIETLRPAISWSRRRSQTCCFQPYKAKPKTMLMVAAVEKIYASEGGSGTSEQSSRHRIARHGSTYCRGHHHPVVHRRLAHDPDPDVETQGAADEGEDEGDKAGNDKIWAPSLGVDVVGARPRSHDLGRRGSHVGRVW